MFGNLKTLPTGQAGIERSDRGHSTGPRGRASLKIPIWCRGSEEAVSVTMAPCSLRLALRSSRQDGGGLETQEEAEEEDIEGVDLYRVLSRWIMAPSRCLVMPECT